MPSNWKTLLVLAYFGGAQLVAVVIAMTKGVLHPNLLAVAVAVALLYMDGVFSGIKLPSFLTKGNGETKQP